MKNNIKSKIKEPQLKLEGEYLEFQNIFKEIKQPKLSSQESNNDHSFHYNVIQTYQTPPIIPIILKSGCMFEKLYVPSFSLLDILIK